MGALERLDIIAPDSASDDASGADAPPQAPAAPAPSPMPSSAPSSASTDAEMVAKIRAAVTAAPHAPRLNNFLAHLVTAKKAFPHDERNAINAALAFANLSSADLRDELSKAVAAALIEAENKIKRDIGQRREELTRELDAETERHRGVIADREARIKELQEQLGTSQAALAQIESTRTQRTAAISGDEAIAFASLGAVKAELTSISNLLP